MNIQFLIALSGFDQPSDFVLVGGMTAGILNEPGDAKGGGFIITVVVLLASISLLIMKIILSNKKKTKDKK